MLPTCWLIWPSGGVQHPTRILASANAAWATQAEQDIMEATGATEPPKGMRAKAPRLVRRNVSQALQAKPRTLWGSQARRQHQWLLATAAELIKKSRAAHEQARNRPRAEALVRSLCANPPPWFE